MRLWALSASLSFLLVGSVLEFYPCKPDIFVATYEPVSGEASRV